jgi:hypothetical protein
LGLFSSDGLQKPYLAADAEATRLSQIAAALLFELGTVDIRRVGTQQSEYSSRGVPSKNDDRRKRFTRNDESRPSLGRQA